MAETLEELYEQIKDCQRCSLSKTRTNLVFGMGDPEADLMLVGEAPGYYEDKQGEPFVGAAGKLLDSLLQSIGLDRSQVYIGNVLKCRPPQNRDPSPDEIKICQGNLFEQIRIIKPRVVCSLGNFATRLILGKNVSISKVRGQCFPRPDYYIYPIYHPAAALHARTNLAALEKDFLGLKELLSKNLEPPPSQPEQMGLF